MVKPAAVALVLLIYPIPVCAQDRVWVAEGTAGYAGFVDDSTKNYWATGGGVRRYLTPRLSVGPELVVMGNSNLVTDRHLMATGGMRVSVAERVSLAAEYRLGWGLHQRLTAAAALEW